MHIPDGFLQPQVWAPLAAASAGAVAYAARRVERDMSPERVPLVGAAAAFVFAAQMVNFRIAAGTSGHLLGGILAAALLGPHAAVLAMTAVLVVQALVFQDGGITALGANIFNMAIIPCYVCWPIAAALGRGSRRAFLAGVAVAAWLAVFLGAVACAVEIGLSGAAPLGAALAAMGGVHAILGLAEAALTVAALSLILRWRPDLVAAVAAQ